MAKGFSFIAMIMSHPIFILKKIIKQPNSIWNLLNW